MIGLLTGIHVLIAVVLILIVLLQSAQGTDVGSAFGGMGSQAAFGPRGTATFLSKATVGLAVAFMLTSIGLSILGRGSSGGGDSVLSGETTAPATSPETTSTPEPGTGTTVPVSGMPGVEATISVEDPATEQGTGDAASEDAPTGEGSQPAAPSN